MEIFTWALFFLWGAFVGGIGVWWLMRISRPYSGTIVVNRDKLTEKTVYSLELDEFPETLAFRKVVIFKVDTPEEGSDRK